MALILAAAVFCVVVVSWDSVAGTETSTESLIIVIAAVPLAAALGILALDMSRNVVAGHVRTEREPP